MTATATCTTTVADARPDIHRRNTAKAKSIDPPPVDANGNVIPHTKRWGYSDKVFANGDIRSLIFVFALMMAFTAFNQTSMAFDLYDSMDRHLTLFQINFYLTYAFVFGVYWLFGALFAFVDLTGRPRWVFKYKIQPFQRVSGKEYINIAMIALRNFIVVVIPLLYLSATYTPARIDPRTLKGPFTTFGILAFNNFCTDVGFYFIHRLFHTTLLYRRFHKYHHHLTAPVAISSTYCTMTEHFFSNLLPNIVGLAIVQPHWSIQTFTFVLLFFGSLCAHSGYNVPWLYSSLQHDWHHFAFNENFGPSSFFDNLFGTSKRFNSVLQDGIQRNKSPDKAREELLSKLARYEYEQE